jgi:hypothetical protein
MRRVGARSRSEERARHADVNALMCVWPRPRMYVCSVSVLRCIVEPCDVLRLSGLIQLVYNYMVWAVRRVVVVEKSPYPPLGPDTRTV